MKKVFKISGTLFVIMVMLGFFSYSCKKDTVDPNAGKTDPGTIATTNLVAYFPFENNGNDMIGNMTPTQSPNVTYVTGKRGKAYQGATRAFLLYNLPSVSPLKSLTGFSISMWFYGAPAIDGVAPVPGIMQIDGTTDPVWGNLMLTQDRMPDISDSLNIKMVFHKEGVPWNNQFVGFPNKAFTENHWIHIVFTYDGSTSKYQVYVNGAPLTLAPGITDRWADGDNIVPRPKLGNLAFANATRFGIGGWMAKIGGTATDEYMGYFTGMIDELRIYNKGLSVTEVKNLFDAEVTQLN